MSLNKFWYLIEVFHYGYDVWELTHFDSEAICVVNLSRQEGVGERQIVTDAVLAFGLLNHFLKGGQATDNSPLRPRSLLVFAEPLAHLLEHAQVLDRLSAGVNNLAQATHLRSLERVTRQELSLAWISLLKELTNSHGFTQCNGLF